MKNLPKIARDIISYKIRLKKVPQGRGGSRHFKKSQREKDVFFRDGFPWVFFFLLKNAL
jgi:hypothetical protein